MPQTRSAVEASVNSEPIKNDEKIRLSALRQEKRTLQARITKMKKEVAKLRAKKRDQEFSTLQNPQQIEERKIQWKDNVETWSKYSGIALDKVFLKEDADNDGTKSIKWDLSGSTHEMPFSVKMVVAVDKSSQQGHVHKLEVETPFPCSSELQGWIDKNDGNIEQVLKTLEAYAEMDLKREQDLDEFKKEFVDNVTVTSDETEGGKVIELFTSAAYYYQIRWKLYPSSRHYGTIKNMCRIACTKDGNELIKLHTDLQTIKKRLNNAPKEVLHTLAKGLRQAELAGVNT